MATDTPSKKRDRSPEYPASSLRTCVEQVRRLYEQDRQNWTSTEVAARHLGYSSLNGTSRTAISAIRKFGLIEYRGGDMRVSDQAMRILLPKSDSERAEALGECLVAPKLYSWVCELYPRWELPSDDTLHARLVRDMDFNAGSTKGFIADLRESIEYVKLSGGLSLAPSNDSEPMPASEPSGNVAAKVINQAPHATSTGHKLSVPGEEWYVWLPDAMTPSSAEGMSAWVDMVLKPTLAFISTNKTRDTGG